jgi:hypothetical protein
VRVVTVQDEGYRSFRPGWFGPSRAWPEGVAPTSVHPYTEPLKVTGRMRMPGRVIVGVAATVMSAVLAVVSTPAGALANDPHIADLAVESQPGHSPASLRLMVGISVTVHNFGPDFVETGQSIADINLPRGTEFWDPYVPSWCTELEPRRHRRCKPPIMIYPDDDNPSGVPGAPPFAILVKMVDKCTEPGEYRVEYEHDPNPSNNAAPLVVIVDGVDPNECGTATPSTGVTAAPSNSDDAGRALPVTGTSVGILVTVGGALIAAGAVLALAARTRRRITRG